MYERNLKQRLLRVAVALFAGACAFGANFSARAGDTVRYTFCTAANCPDGTAPPVADLLKTANSLYGTAQGGGQYDNGTVFSVNPNGAGFTVLHSFGSITNDGSFPTSGVIKIGNRLYGTTDSGGQFGEGIIYSVRTNGTGYTVLHAFNGIPSDGAFPYGGLIDVGGMLYGTTTGGGASNFCSGCGTVFEILPSGASYQVMYSFCSLANCTDGGDPFARLLEVNGTLYGTTGAGGSFGLGTVFSFVPCVSPPCAEQVLYSFGTHSPDGDGPVSGLIYKSVGGVGYLYGTTPVGGITSQGTVFSVVACGNPPCAESWLYSFAGDPGDGANPDGGLLAWGSYLYGTTTQGGPSNLGTVFKIRADGLSAETPIYSFGGSPDGANPLAGLVRIGGELYGTTTNGGNVNASCSEGCGTVFSIP